MHRDILQNYHNQISFLISVFLNKTEALQHILPTTFYFRLWKKYSKALNGLKVQEYMIFKHQKIIFPKSSFFWWSFFNGSVLLPIYTTTATFITECPMILYL